MEAAVAEPLADHRQNIPLQTFGEDYEASKRAKAAYLADQVAQVWEDIRAGTLDAASGRVIADNSVDSRAT